ncbi:hypothetical protein CPB83DRAFT_725251, partial [Crepidotus variabilis]
PEVVPGEGLPSLKSLGLTSKDLYNMKPEFFNSSIETRSKHFDNSCNPYSTGNFDDAIACYNYLVRIGHWSCLVTPTGRSKFCVSGDAAIQGYNFRSDGNSVSSPCSYVALAAQWVLTHC